ncbi:hypothetical protein FO519_009455 [Halicephalobus sp. NKZ332]|nr:hypothetical protein FO519_009455 [Halicephalobus sp. NKZ332]
MSSVDIGEVKFCIRNILKKFDYEKLDLDQRSLTKLKSLIKFKSELIPEFENYLMENLRSNDSDLRLCIVLITDYFFQRSHAFRNVLLDDLQEFLTYTVELDPLYCPLPGPTKAAISLKKEALQIFKLWDEKFANGYPKLGRTKTMLLKSKKFNLDRVDGLTTVERSREEAERIRKNLVDQRVLSEVYKEFNDSRVHIEEAVAEAKTALNLLFPDFREEEAGPSTSAKFVNILPEKVVVPLPSGVSIEKSEDNLGLLDSLKDSQKLLTSNLGKVSEWMKKASKHGGSGPVVDSLLKIQQELKNELSRCKEIKDPEGLGEESVNVVQKPIEEKKPPEITKPVLDPNPLKRRTVIPKDESQSASKYSAPVLPYGLDLKYWGEDVTPAELPRNNVDDHGFWRPPDEGQVNRESEDVYKARVITFISEMPEITRSCRAPLPSGNLCPRMDRKVCPLHGPIIDRDAEGNPVNIGEGSSSTPLQRSHEEFVRKQKEAEEDSFLKDLEVQTGGKFSYDLAKNAKKKVARKKREKAPGEALRDRMTFLFVKDFEDSDECIKLPLEANRLPLITVKQTFSDSQGLFYRSGEDLNAVGLLTFDDVLKEPFYKEPEGGWANKTFFVKRGARPVTSAAAEVDVDHLVSGIENYLFFEEVGNVKYCFTVISTHHAVSFNHGHHQDWVASPSQNSTTVIICDQEGRKFETKVVESDAEVDFVVVKSEVPLVSKPPVIGIPRKLERYILLGYPNSDSNYQALEGVFSSIERDEEGRMRGSSGSKYGYSGGPIFNYKGDLLGINVVNESSAKFIGFNGKSTVNELINEVNATFPFLSVIVPVYYMASRYRKYCKFKH